MEMEMKLEMKPFAPLLTHVLREILREGIGHKRGKYHNEAPTFIIYDLPWLWPSYTLLKWNSNRKYKLRNYELQTLQFSMKYFILINITMIFEENKNFKIIDKVNQISRDSFHSNDYYFD